MKKFFGIAISILVVVGALLVYNLQKSDVQTLRVNGSALAAPKFESGLNHSLKGIGIPLYESLVIPR